MFRSMSDHHQGDFLSSYTFSHIHKFLSWYLDMEVTFELLCFVLLVGVLRVRVYWTSSGVCSTLLNIKLIKCIAGTMTDVKNKVNIGTKLLTF
jgi:hypothetical protein